MDRSYPRWAILLLLPMMLTTNSFAEEPSWQRDVTTHSPELGKLLRELNQKYGPDAVSLLSWLNDATIRSGSVLTATVGVTGKETKENTTFMVVQVETGIIFNTQKEDQTSRLRTLWEKILADAFSHLDNMRIPTDGVRIDLLSHCKSFTVTDALTEHMDEPGPIETVKFYFSGDSLRAYLYKQLPAQALFSDTKILVNEVPAPFSPVGDAPKIETRTPPA
ncbi:MAG: hypothetical protein EXR78_03615 [Deltaproteobacteria bacterium]|nr:hypothetical protein [Deltaproteobacteria bacterium]